MKRKTARPDIDHHPNMTPGMDRGSENPIKSPAEGQHLLETGYHYNKQIYNMTKEGEMIKFQPDHTPENGYHAYRVSKLRDISPAILKQMLYTCKV